MDHAKYPALSALLADFEYQETFHSVYVNGITGDSYSTEKRTNPFTLSRADFQYDVDVTFEEKAKRVSYSDRKRTIDIVLATEERELDPEDIKRMELISHQDGEPTEGATYWVEHYREVVAKSKPGYVALKRALMEKYPAPEGT
jgi:hypothetical protein